MTDEDLLRPLRDVEPPPTTITADSLVRSGRRRVRVRNLTGAGATAALVLIATPVVVAALRDAPEPERTVAAPATSAKPVTRPAAPAAPTSCRARPLAVPSGTTSSQVLGGDPSGRYLVGVAQAGNRTSALLWDRGRMTVLQPPTSDVETLVVNARGVVAGFGGGVGEGASGVAWVYRDGKYTVLDDTGESKVVAINARDDVLSSRGHSTSSAPPGVWPAGSPTTKVMLPLPQADFGTAAGLNDDGDVVGTAWVGGIAAKKGGSPQAPVGRALSWPQGGTMSELPKPAGARSVSANALSGSWALGYAQGPGTDSAPVRWNLRIGEALTDISLSYVQGINAHGWVTGFVRDNSGRETPAAQFGTRVTKLPVPDGAVASGEGPVAGPISDDGRVIGGTVATGAETLAAIRWTCS